MFNRINFSSYFFIVGFLIVGLLAACQFKETRDETTESVASDCLPPLFDFSFPYKDEGITENIHSLPPIADIILQVDENEQPIMVAKDNLVVRDDNEIWLVDPLMRYTPSTKEIQEYTIKDGNGGLVHPTALFVGTDKSLFVTANNSTYDSIVFAHYDDRNDQFEIISSENDIFQRSGGGGVNTIVEDQDGKLWFVNQKNLIRLDPKSSQAERVLGEEQGYSLWNSLVITSENSLFLAARKLEKMGGGEVVRSDPQIIQYDIQSGDIQHFGFPTNDPKPVVYLFIDSQERLWVSDYGYLEFNDDSLRTWYQIIRSPIFISDQSGNFQYSWARPVPKVETHHRYLWFTFSGLARLDLEKNEWCLVTRTPVLDVAKDSQDNLWIISNKQLYKYEFQP